jgi:hypothetical protein
VIETARLSHDGLPRAFLRALDDFRSSYVLRYSPHGVAAGGWHEIAVRVTRPGRGYVVRARKGYVGGMIRDSVDLD